MSLKTIRYWWNRFGPMFCADIRRRRILAVRTSRWPWHLDEVFVRINGERHWVCRDVNHDGEALESYGTRTRDRKAALKFLKRMALRHGRPEAIVTDKLRSYGTVVHDAGNVLHEKDRWWVNNRAETSHNPFR